METPLSEADISDILESFQSSRFDRLFLKFRSTRIASEKSALPARAAPAGAEPVGYIRAPAVGVFKARRDPPDALLPGRAVGPKTPIGSIRTSRSEIPVDADTHGTLMSSLVKDGEFVEFGQPLFEIQTARP